MAEWNAARSQSRFGAEVVRHLGAQPVHLRQHEEKLGTDLRGTLQQINRLRRKGGDTEDLLQELGEKEKIYGRGKQQRPGGAYLATNQIFSTE